MINRANPLCVVFYILGSFHFGSECLGKPEKVAPDERHQISDLNDKALALRDAGKFKEALAVADQCFTRCEKMLGPEDPDTATLSNNLALIYQSLGNYTRAEQLYQRALNIREKIFGPDSSEVAHILHNMGAHYSERGQYAKAELLYRRALRIREKALGPDHIETAQTLSGMGVLYLDWGKYKEAEAVDKRALKIREKKLGPTDRQTGTSVGNLAALYHSVGDYAKAETLYRRAVKISEDVLGKDHYDTATQLSNLALFYTTLGDYAKAEPLLLRAIPIYEKSVGISHADTARALLNLGGVYKSMREFDKAKPLFERSVKGFEKSLGAEHPFTATSLNDLADLQMDTGDSTGAEPLYQRALKIREKSCGPEHVDTAASLNSLAILYHKNGQLEKAEALYERALRIRIKALGSEHRVTAATLYNLAYLYLDETRTVDATRLARLLSAPDQKYWAQILSFASERQRLAFEAKSKPYGLFADAGLATELANTVIWHKGIVLDSLLEDRSAAVANDNVEGRLTLADIGMAKQRLMQLLLGAPRDDSKGSLERRESERRILSERVDELEARLGRRIAKLGRVRRALTVTLEQVRNSLPAGQALLEFIIYEHYLGQCKWEKAYGAVLIAPDVESKWIPLGTASDIDRNVALYQKSVRGLTDTTTLDGLLHGLYSQLWTPIAKALPSNIKTVILSPDSELCFVSFATLVGSDERFLAEKCDIRYVASGRDLLTRRTSSENSMTFIYADPDFGGQVIPAPLQSFSPPPSDAIEARDLRNFALVPLPGTKAEALALEKRLPTLSVRMFVGPNATESALRKVDSPHILHLATHGFFLPNRGFDYQTASLRSEGEIPIGRMPNPMHRSGLALAGAQGTLEMWGHGKAPPVDNDGIVTAEEVGGLKLDRTWLVVLSACDTGSGEAKAGEGVMGLRRGFVLAGTQNLLMTLWPISDETTVHIMMDFYDRALKSGDAPRALADTQREWLIRLREERGSLAAVQLAGPFIMSSQGNF